MCEFLFILLRRRITNRVKEIYSPWFFFNLFHLYKISSFFIYFTFLKLQSPEQSLHNRIFKVRHFRYNLKMAQAVLPDEY